MVTFIKNRGKYDSKFDWVNIYANDSISWYVICDGVLNSSNTFF